MRVLRTMLVVLGLGATPLVFGQDIPVTISFDGGGCPTGVNPDYVQISKANGDKVAWQAQPANFDFDIYFDPFQGRPISSRGGYVKSPPIDGRTPSNVEFKYTVVGANCPGRPYDPRIKIL